MKPTAKREERKQKFSLFWLFSGFFFAMILLSGIITFLVTLLLLEIGTIEWMSERATVLPFIFIIVMSTLLGSIMAISFSRFILNPVRKIISATDRLARGDFSVRLELRAPSEFSALSKSFNHMAEELGGIEMLRSDFINDFSHEFKTPIMSIGGFARLLRREGLTDEQKSECIDAIVSESDRLAGLAANVLNLSKIEKQNIITGKEMTNLTELLRRALAMLEQKWSGKHIEFIFEGEEVSASVNGELIYQVMTNLIDNAVKFSPDYSEIRIGISEGNGRTSFFVEDSGPGIKPEMLPHIFEKFYQGDSSHATAGNGLGLPLCQQIVSKHGGEIRIDTAHGKGSKFTVSLPTS